ncbi:MAG: cell division protein FtsL [Ferrovum sp.]|nr:cell division protein FtsL [Ferrovum sp.]NDU86981.1 cell division protein FtsL [Ferrovum sp.]
MSRSDILLFVCVVVLALGVIHGQQHARRLFIDLQQARDQQVQLQTEGDQLQIEEGTLSASRRVEDRAIRGLKMQLPKSEQKRLVVLGQPGSTP